MMKNNLLESDDNSEDDYINKDLHLAIKLENESSRRTRRILSFLIVASCLALACFWNSLQGSWKHSRVETFKKYITQIDNAAKNKKERSDYQSQLIKLYNQSTNNNDTSDNKNLNTKYDNLIKFLLLDSIIHVQDRIFANEIPKSEFDTAFYSQYYGKDALGMDNLRLMYLVYWISEARDIKSFRIPFFDVNFDINDLGFIGGLGFSIILLVFYLSLIREKENIKIAFKASDLKYKKDYKKRRQFYYLLSMNQLIIMPHIMNKKGKRIFKILPLTLLCFPFIFSFCVFINDIRTIKYGTNFSTGMTSFGYCTCIIFLVLIILFTTICFFEIYAIDRLWKEEKILLDNNKPSENQEENINGKSIS
jgi:hypothetical protein